MSDKITVKEQDVINTLLQKNAELTLENAQLQSLLKQSNEKEKAE